MFSGLSKLADKSFVLGFFLPSLVGTLAFIVLNRDVEPFSKLLQESLQEKTLADLTVMLLAVWMLSVLLMAGSHWMYRVLEGYAWPLNNSRLRARQLERRKLQRTKVRAAYEAVSAAENLPNAPTVTSVHAEQQPLLNELKLDYLRLRRMLALEYPEERELVLPTRFGNVLRAFEMYAGTVHGVESIHAWPRLLAVVPKDYQVTLADARAPVDFFVSLVFISFMLGTAALVRGGVSLISGPASAGPWGFGAIAVVAFAVVRLCYLAALASAIAWGEVVKSTFDLYLPALANAMGYELPKTAEARRQFWEAVANQFQFHEPLNPEAWQTRADPLPRTEDGTKSLEKHGEGDVGNESDDGDPEDEETT